MNTLGHETFPLYSFSLPFVSGTHTHKRPCVYKCNLFLERKSAKSVTHVTEARIERVEEIRIRSRSNTNLKGVANLLDVIALAGEFFNTLTV